LTSMRGYSGYFKFLEGNVIYFNYGFLNRFFGLAIINNAPISFMPAAPDFIINKYDIPNNHNR